MQSSAAGHAADGRRAGIAAAAAGASVGRRRDPERLCVLRHYVLTAAVEVEQRKGAAPPAYELDVIS